MLISTWMFYLPIITTCRSHLQVSPSAGFYELLDNLAFTEFDLTTHDLKSRRERWAYSQLPTPFRGQFIWPPSSPVWQCLRRLLTRKCSRQSKPCRHDVYVITNSTWRTRHRRLRPTRHLYIAAIYTFVRSPIQCLFGTVSFSDRHLCLTNSGKRFVELAATLANKRMFVYFHLATHVLGLETTT